MGYGYSGSAPACDSDGTLMSGLVGYWKFDESGSSASFADSSGNNNTGTAVGGSISSSVHTPDPNNIFKNAGTFNGSLSVTLSNTALINLPNKHTLSIWVKPSSFLGDTTVIVNNYQLIINSSTIFDVLFNPTYNYLNNTGVTTAVGTWYHIVSTYDKDAGNNNAKLYINSSNGQPKDSITIVGPLSAASQQRIGAAGSAYQNFNGLIDDVRIYNRALSGSEISNLYNSGSGCF